MLPLMEMRNVSKHFPGVKALDGVDFDLYPGEVHALCGENGAGKSTLIKIFGGIYQQDNGEILIDGHQAHLTNPRVSQDFGIRIVHQELNLVESRTVAENIFLGRFPVGKIRLAVSWTKLIRETKSVLDKMGINLDPNKLVKNLSVGEKQMVEIVRAVSDNVRVVIMDEPTAALSTAEIEILFELISSIKKHGIAVIYISHRLDEIFAIADRVTVIRDGEKIGCRNIKDTNTDELVNMMVGRSLEDMYPKIPTATKESLFRVTGLTTHEQLKDVSFHLNKGEILGVYGIAGSGQEELSKALIGACPVSQGEIEIDNKKVKIMSPKQALKLGIGLAPLERKLEGLVLDRSVKENITLSHLNYYTRYGAIKSRAEEATVNRWISDLKIRTPSLNQSVVNLSGGNQQKVVLARLMETNAKIIVLNEPTRGIDVGAKVEVYVLMEKLCSEGKGVLMISTDLIELLGISDRIMVMCRGRITGVFNREEATQEEILKCAVGEAVYDVNNRKGYSGSESGTEKIYA